MEKKIELAPTVIFIDASCFDRICRDMTGHFSPILERELTEVNLASMLECLALDNNVALKSPPGEFIIRSFQPFDMATNEELFNEALVLAGESKDVKRAIAVADEDSYQKKAHSVLNKIKGKDSVTLFGMNPPKVEAVYSL